MKRTYFPPIAARTGRPSEQPRAADLVPGFNLDANLEWSPPGFLDAPARVPAGSVRAADCGDVTLGEHDVERAQ